MLTEKSEACPQCGCQRWIPIAYGYPGPEMRDAAEKGELVLGGCVVWGGDPQWRCRVCAYEQGEPRWTGVDGPTDGEFADFHQVAASGTLPGPEASPSQISRFALSFDGYAAFGVEQSRSLARDTEAEFRKTGQVPGNVASLRNALFFAQRRAHHTDAPLRSDYVMALLHALTDALGSNGSSSAMETADLPDFAALFAEDSESNAGRSWTLSPRTAFALWEAADNLCHLACHDITDFGSAPYDPDDGLWWQVFWRYPKITWEQDELWRQHATWAFRDLANALAAGEWPMPQTAAEEMALWLAIEDAEIRVGELYGDLVDDFEALPTHKNDCAWDDCRDYLFYDHDILFLFDETLGGIEDPGSAMHGVVPDVADYRPQSWFEPFWGMPPRDLSREPYDEARARQAARRKKRPSGRPRK